MILLLSLIVIAVVAFSQYRNGLFTSFAVLVQVVLAGLVAFGFWEPVADELDSYFRDGKLAGYEDCIALAALFALTMFGLRQVTNRLNKAMIDFDNIVQQAGGPVLGAVTGYLLSGFLVCMMETMPLEDKFLGFEPRKDGEAGLRSYFPADRVWLALMRHAGAYPLTWKEAKVENEQTATAYDRSETFDRDGTFELRYLRHRRHTEKDVRPMPYHGEFSKELGRR